GRIGKDLPRAHLALREAIDDRALGPSTADEVAAVTTSVRRAMAVLDDRVPDDDREALADLEPLVGRLLASYWRALAALEAGQVEAADRVLDDVLPLAARVQPLVADMAERNRAEIARTLGVAGARFGALGW